MEEGADPDMDSDSGSSAGASPGRGPVLLIHGFTGSADTTWRPTGLIDLLQESGREVLAPDLWGHGRSAMKSHDPNDYEGLETELLGELPEGAPVDVVGFSAGARIALVMAATEPRRFSRLVVAGVGRNLFHRDPDRSELIARAVAGEAEPGDVVGQAFARYASQSGQDPLALAAFLRRPTPPLGVAELGRIDLPVLVALGDADFVGPADELLAALPDARLHQLRGTDHFATPKSFDLLDAVLGFLGTSP